MKTRSKAAPRMSDAAVQTKTGKTWSQWFAALDKAGARKMTHQEIVALLRTKHGVGPWWQQMVTVGYEQARGMRAPHQKPSGYEISRSKTIAAPASRLFDAWQDAKTRARWLGREAILIRKATPRKSMRITWADGETSVEVNFLSKSAGKVQVSVQHSKLADAKHAERMKEYWAGKLARLGQVVAE